MIIPVRCVTCGKVLADKWRAYQARTAKDRDEDGKSSSKSTDKTGGGPDGLMGERHAAVLDDMGITKLCCRRHMLTNVDAMDRI